MINISIIYNKNNANLLQFVESVQMNERLDGKASTFQLVLNNYDGRFTNSWQATQGDGLSVQLGIIPPEFYTIDKITIQRIPQTVTWSCIARARITKRPQNAGNGSKPPTKGAFVDSRISWDYITTETFKSICQRVCNECGLKLKYTAKDNPTLQGVKRYNETGYNLIDRYCKRLGFGLHADAETLVILSNKSKEEKAEQSTITIDETLIKSLSQITDIKPQKVVSASFNPRTKQYVKKEFGDGDGEQIEFDYDIDDAQNIYENISNNKKTVTLDVAPNENYTCGVIMNVQGVDFKIIEMAYSRTADTENQSILLKAV